MRRFLTLALAVLMMALPAKARTLNFSDFYRPTVDGLRLHQSPSRYVALEGEKGGGKTVAACAEIILLSMEFPGNRGMIFRQKLSTLERSTMTTFRKLCPKELIADDIPSQKKILLINGSEVLYGGLSGNALASENAIRMYLEDLKSFELGWFYLNEGSQTRKEFWDTLKTTLRWRPPSVPQEQMFYRGMADSNPEPGWFYKTFIRQLPRDHERIHFFAKNNPGLPPDYYEGFTDMPESWKTRYEKGLWIFDQEGDMWVYPYQMVEESFQVVLMAHAKDEIVYGLDPSGAGADEAVLTRRHGPRFRQWCWKGAVKAPELRDRVCRVLAEQDRYFELPKELRPYVNCDIHGMGGPVAEILAEKAVRVGEVNLQGRISRPERFVDRRSELFWLLRERMEEHRADFAEDEILREQAIALQFEADGNKRIKVEEKKKYKARMGFSPDRLESAVYANADVAPQWRKGNWG